MNHASISKFSVTTPQRLFPNGPTILEVEKFLNDKISNDPRMLTDKYTFGRPKDTMWEPQRLDPKVRFYVSMKLHDQEYVEAEYTTLVSSMGSPQEFQRMLSALADYFVTELQDKIHKSAYNRLGEYPNVRLWAVKHLAQRPDAMPPTQPIPGWIWPRWNAKHPGMIAGKYGGVAPTVQGLPTTKPTTETTGEDMANLKGATKGIMPKSGRVKKPQCPKHDRDMTLDTEENIWRCREDGCKIIFRPKQDERPEGSLLVGKGRTSMKIVVKDGAPHRFFFVSDDNVAVEVSGIMQNIEMKSNASYVDVNDPFSMSVKAIPSGTTNEVTITFVGMNITQVKES